LTAVDELLAEDGVVFKELIVRLVDFLLEFNVELVLVLSVELFKDVVVYAWLMLLFVARKLAGSMAPISPRQQPNKSLHLESESLHPLFRKKIKPLSHIYVKFIKLKYINRLKELTLFQK
jgi:hypothetical protein